MNNLTFFSDIYICCFKTKTWVVIIECKGTVSLVRVVIDIHLLSLSLQKQPTEVFCEKKVFLKISQYSQENTCARVSFSQNNSKRLDTLIKYSDTLAQVFSSEFCEIFKKTFFIEQLQTTASVDIVVIIYNAVFLCFYF